MRTVAEVLACPAGAPHQTDFILLPCDFLPPPSLSLTTLLDAHRSRPSPTLTSLFYERAELGKDGPERVLVGYEGVPGPRRAAKGPEGGRLLFVKELEDTEDDIVVRLSMLRKYVCSLISSYLSSRVRPPPHPTPSFFPAPSRSVMITLHPCTSISGSGPRAGRSVMKRPNVASRGRSSAVSSRGGARRRVLGLLRSLPPPSWSPRARLDAPH